MNEQIQERLKRKLISLVNHVTELKAQKRAFLSATNEQIAGAEKRIVVIGEAFKEGNLKPLFNIFSEDELKFLDEVKQH